MRVYYSGRAENQNNELKYENIDYKCLNLSLWRSIPLPTVSDLLRLSINTAHLSWQQLLTENGKMLEVHHVKTLLRFSRLDGQTVLQSARSGQLICCVTVLLVWLKGLWQRRWKAIKGGNGQLSHRGTIMATANPTTVWAGFSFDFSLLLTD